MDREIRDRSDAAGTRPHHRYVVSAGDVADRIDGFVKRGDISVEPPVAVFDGWIAPADGERLDAAIEQEPDHAFIRRQVRRVIFVDLRRRYHQWALPHCRRGRSILDELDQLIAEHHRAGRSRQILTYLESGDVDLRRQRAIL